MKNRSLIAQKDELSLLFKEESDLLRHENEVLRRELAVSKEELRVSLTNTAYIPEPSAVVTDFNLQLNEENRTLRD